MEKTGIQIEVYNTLDMLPENPWRQRTEWLEYDLAVKWFAVEARCGGEPAGFMHVIRHPGRDNEWYACDVFTMEPYRRQGVAAAMYAEVRQRLARYWRANRLTASISRGNEASVRLHVKTGFRDTGEAPALPDFHFEPDETLYELWLAREFPARNVPMHRQILADLAGERQDSVLAALEQSESDAGKTVFIIWAGTEAAGYRFSGDDIPVLKAEWEARRQNGCLTVRQG